MVGSSSCGCLQTEIHQKLKTVRPPITYCSGTVATTFYFLLTENNEARKTQVLFHVNVLKDTVDEDILPVSNTG